ncbi:MAG: serine/threonine protein kinase, partial [Planctomycetota bacterium]
MAPRPSAAPSPQGPSGRLIGKPVAARAADPQATATLPATPTTGERRETRGPALPRRLGVYEVCGELARGGMGVVLRARHPKLGRDVAIKLLRPDACEEDDVARERFLREARATARLRHPGIVAIHDIGTDASGRDYLVMDLVRGPDLKTLLAREPLGPRRAAALLQKVCEAVAHAHEHGILHRDLKPANVLVDERSGEPLLTDFGLAKTVGRQTATDSGRFARGAAARDASGVEPSLTQDGDVMGTPLYMAPEQVDPARGPVSPKTDVWALGVVLYECLTGRTPFARETVWDIFRAILDEHPEPPRSLCPEVPEELEAIVLRCLEKHPLGRYRSARALAKDLERFLAGGQPLAQPHRAPRPRRRRGSPLLLLALLATLGVLLASPSARARLRRAARA